MAGRSSPVPFDQEKPPSCIRLVGLPGTASGDELVPVLLPLRAMQVKVEIHLAVALVRVVGKFMNPMPEAVDAVLEVPTTQETTVTNASLFLLGGRVVDTMVVDSSEMASMGTDSSMASAIGRYKPSEGTAYNPAVFRVPVTAVPKNSEVSFEVVYFENLRFSAGEFSLRVPLRFEPPSMVEGGIAMLPRVLDLAVDVNTGTPGSSKGGRASGHHLVFTSGGDALAAHGSGAPTPVASGTGIPARFQLALKTGTPVPNEDFVISYTAWSTSILANALVERVGPTESGVEQGVMALFLSPPRLESVGASFGRSVAFLLDNSGSMSGSPLRVAKAALKQCLAQLGPSDSFAVCIFNHRRKWWRGESVYDKYAQEEGTDATAPDGPVVWAADASNLSMISAFVESVVPSGMTDILTPMQQAHAVLSGAPKSTTRTGLGGAYPGGGGGSAYPGGGGGGSAYPGGGGGGSAYPGGGGGGSRGGYPGAAAVAVAPPPMPGHLAEFDDLASPAKSGTSVMNVPIVFLITDGAVAGERGIVQYIRDAGKASLDAAERAKASGTVPQPATRVFTFGIGQWVNDHFLRMAAQVGRGHYGAALKLDTLEADIVALMERSSAPVLTDLAVGARGVTSFECFPFPLPDLYCGSPVIVSAQYTGAHPAEVLIRGRLPSGEMTTWTTPVFWSKHVPVAKVFARKQLDILVAQHWLIGGDPTGSESSSNAAATGASYGDGGGKGGAGGSSAEALALHAKIVDLSTQQQVPCPYTSMVGYTTTADAFAVRKKEQAEEEAARKAGKPPPESAKGDASAGKGKGKGKGAGGAGGRGMSRGAKVALAGGAVVALGATVGALAATGSVAASASAVGGLVTGAIQGIGGGIGNMQLPGIGIPNCDCFGVDCGECGGLPGFLDGCFGDCGTCCGDALQCVPDTIGGCFAGIGTCCSGDVCEGLGGCFSEGIGSCSACVAGAGACIGGSCSGFAGVLTECGGQCGGMAEGVCGCVGGGFEALSGIGDCAGGIADCLGGILN